MDIEMNNPEACKAESNEPKSRLQYWFGLPFRLAIYGWVSALIMLGIVLLFYFLDTQFGIGKAGVKVFGVFFVLMAFGCNCFAVITGALLLIYAAFKRPKPPGLAKTALGFIMGIPFVIYLLLCWIYRIK